MDIIYAFKATQRYVHSNFSQMCKAVNNLKFE